MFVEEIGAVAGFGAAFDDSEFRFVYGYGDDLVTGGFEGGYHVFSAGGGEVDRGRSLGCL